ncbi:hypothetical protein [Pseudarthrobacter sp. MEB009]|uniref:hypothetical protein n=1 Tax=Pseudarthrobacter sp. MEB009 TaxID=3040326 RepID=UPI002555C52D|nr:hypothetical protein [Pseudarthrobacter sp. MEB009]
MRIRRTLQAAALIAAAVLLGLLTVQGTYALWNASALTAPGTVSAASFDVAMTSTLAGQATSNMTLPSGQSANLNLGPTAALQPGDSVQAGVVVTNNSNASGAFSTAFTVGQPSVTDTPTVADPKAGLAHYLTVTAKTAATAAQCNDTTGYGAVTGLRSPAVAKGGATVFCFRVSLSQEPDSSVKGKAVNITLPMTARQCGVSGDC